MKSLNGIIHRPALGIIILAYLAFIALGMPDGLHGIAWPSMRASFSLPLDALGSLLVFSTAGYLTSSFLSGRLLTLIGVGRLLVISGALTGAAFIGYTLVPVWWLLVAMGVLAGLGVGAIDAGLNTYVAAHFSTGYMQWLHASYGIGITFGALLMTAGINTFQSWRVGYITVGSLQLLLAICFTLTLPMWNRNERTDSPDRVKRLTDYRTPYGKTLRQVPVWLSLLLFLLYTGAEVTVGVWIYSLLTESRNIPPEAAGLLVGSYWAIFTVGRIVAGLYAKRIGVNKLVLGSLAAAFIGACLLWWNPASLANLIAVGVIGFAIAPIFPGLVSGTSQRVGPHFAANTIGMQMATASLGAAIIPSLVGVLAEHNSLEVIPVCLIALFALLIGLYAVSVGKPPMEVDYAGG